MIRLSILTPSIPSRADRLAELTASIAEQIGDKPVEHLVLIDNKRRTIGEKRQALLEAAIGEYIAFVDDDDEIMPGYVPEILKAIEQRPHVITFDQDAYFDGVKYRVNFRHGQTNEELNPKGITKRAAWHVCAWRRSVAASSFFEPINYGEDWAWAAPLNIEPLNEVHIDKVLHAYHFRSEVTEAMP